MWREFPNFILDILHAFIIPALCERGMNKI